MAEVKRRPEQREPGLDWVRVGHRMFTFLRSLRGDGEQVAADQRVELTRGATMNQTIEQIARRAVGCRLPDACSCAICDERRKE